MNAEQMEYIGDDYSTVMAQMYCNEHSFEYIDENGEKVETDHCVYCGIIKKGELKWQATN